MTLQQWATNGWLKSHKTSKEEIGNLLAIARRDRQDADELLEYIGELEKSVLDWLTAKHPELLA